MTKAALKPTHEAQVDVPCLRCGETTTESVYRVWHSRELVCRACGALVSLASEEVQREADRAERDWRERWGTIGWHFPGSEWHGLVAESAAPGSGPPQQIPSDRRDSVGQWTPTACAWTPPSARYAAKMRGAALERAEEKVLEDAQPLEDNVVALASRRR